MPTYVALLNFTDQGIRTVRDTLDRIERAAELAQKHGARLEQLYWTVGPYDLVGIVEAPDEESATAFFARGRLRRSHQDHHASGVRPRRDVANHREARTLGISQLSNRRAGAAL